MAVSLTTGLLIGATLLGGLLAGGNFDRALVAMPAWSQVGAEAWASFSRRADLGNGLVLYPLEAIGAAALTLAAAVAYYFDRAAARTAAVPLYAAVLFALLGLLVTLRAAPIMLGIRDATNVAELGGAFASFWYWGNIRGVCQILSFMAQVAALTVLARHAP